MTLSGLSVRRKRNLQKLLFIVNMRNMAIMMCLMLCMMGMMLILSTEGLKHKKRSRRRKGTVSNELWVNRHTEDFAETTGGNMRKRKQAEAQDEAVNLGVGSSCGSSESEAGPVAKKAKKKPKASKRSGNRKSTENEELLRAFEGMTSNFVKILQNMSSSVAKIVEAFSAAEQREQKKSDRADNILNELVNIPGLTTEEVFRAAKILIAEPGIMSVFYQAPVDWRKDYVHILIDSSIAVSKPPKEYSGV